MVKKPVILLVEDEALIAMFLEMELLEAGYSVLGIVSTGEEAVELANQQKPDLVILDVRLAGEINGIETAQRLKKTGEIPIIFLTGYLDIELMETIKTIKPAGCFIKPVRFREIDTAIRSALGC
ncbi:response regulator [bacterium]|nr:response regulator [candidate division CSSED10-310 bacterium]